MSKVLVIGLDGATFDVITPFIEEGLLPNISELIQSGASGALESTMPPVTGPAWLALATSITPGRSGIFDFIFREDAGKNSFRFINSSDFKGKAVWDVLCESGKKVCLFNYPCLYPPYRVNGSMVSGGLGSPSLSKFTYPEDIEREMLGILGDERQLNLKDPKYSDLDILLKDLNDSLEKSFQAIEHLLSNDRYDFAWPVISQTDWLQHMMWDYYDKSNSEKLNDFEKYNKGFKEFWSNVDKGIGRLREIAGADTNIVIVSDHGFGPVKESFKLNVWLRENGYLTLRRGGWKGFTFTKKIRKLARNLAKVLKIDVILPSFFTWCKDKTVSIMIPLHFIDYDKTTAYDPGHIGSFGGIYINKQALPNESDYEKVRDEIIEKLQTFGKEHALEVDILRPEQAYGKRAKNSLDLILRINDGGCLILKEFDGNGRLVEYNSLPQRIAFLRGTHRMKGVFIASGPDFTHTVIDGARLFDIAPTILQCFGKAVPEYMSGEILKKTLNPETLEKKIKDASEPGQDNKEKLSNQEEAAIKKQLTDLGYF